MRKCTGNNTHEWGFDAIFSIDCPTCSKSIEFFKDEIFRLCPNCSTKVVNPRDDYGCNQWCSSSSQHARNLCPKFKKSKHRFIGFLV